MTTPGASPCAVGPTRISPGSAVCWSLAARLIASPGGERRVAVLDHQLAGLDADPDRQLAVAALDDRDGRPDGALGVVLVGGRHAEDRKHGVAGELLDGSAVRVDVPLDAIEEAGHLTARHLGIARRDQRGRVDQVDEHRRRELPFHP